MQHAKELSTAIEAALAGGRVLQSFYHSSADLMVRYKGELDLVTKADTESEKAVLAILERRCAGVSIVAEESGVTAGDSERRFFVDPLDGTTNFAHGYPMFCVSIGYEQAGEMMVAVVFDPVKDELFTAVRGEGAYLNGRPLKVSSRSELDSAVLVTGFPYDRWDDVDAALRFFRAFLRSTRAIRRDGSAALDLCYLAAGRVDGFWEEKLGPWDTAAGALIVEQAGGQVSQFDGGRFHCTDDGICASNGPLQQKMLAVIQEVR